MRPKADLYRVICVAIDGHVHWYDMADDRLIDDIEDAYSLGILPDGSEWMPALVVEGSP